MSRLSTLTTEVQFEGVWVAGDATEASASQRALVGEGLGGVAEPRIVLEALLSSRPEDLT